MSNLPELPENDVEMEAVLSLVFLHYHRSSVRMDYRVALQAFVLRFAHEHPASMIHY